MTAAAFTQHNQTAQGSRLWRRFSADGSRWFGVSTLDRDKADDGRLEAAAAEMADGAALVVGFVGSDRFSESAVAAMRRGCGSVPLIGCSSSGLVESPGDLAGAVQLVAFGGPGFAASTAIQPYTPGGCREAGSLVTATASGARAGDHEALVLLCDGLEGDVADVIRGAYSTAGAGVPIVGGCAGDDLAMERTWQFCADTICHGGVAAARLSSNSPIGIGVDHGWTPLGEPMVVTGSSGTSVETLDDRPAMDMYLATVGGEAHVSDSAAFARFAQTRPLGLCEQDSGQIRFVTGGDHQRRTLNFLVHIPEGQLVWVMNGNRASVLEATRKAAAEAVAKLDGHEPLGVVAFDCVARRSVIGDDSLRDEAHALSETLRRDVPYGGFYTYGEIARTGGALGLHHQTMVVLAVS